MTDYKKVARLDLKWTLPKYGTVQIKKLMQVSLGDLLKGYGTIREQARLNGIHITDDPENLDILRLDVLRDLINDKLVVLLEDTKAATEAMDVISTLTGTSEE
jgi:hypothetical protein